MIIYQQRFRCRETTRDSPSHGRWYQSAASSIWLCSRNDLIASVGVLLAAGASYLLASQWPNIVVGVIIAGLFVASAANVLRDAYRQWRTAPTAPKPALVIIRRPTGGRRDA